MNRFRFLAKSVIHGAIDWSGKPRRRRHRLRGQLIILTYHSFCSDWHHGLFNSLPLSRFERQIQFLKKNFQFVSLEQGLSDLKQGKASPQPRVSITMDDGFQDNYTLAWPVLRRYRVPATIFLATDFIDNIRPPWPSQLLEILERTQATEMAFPFRADLSTLPMRSAASSRLKSEWKALDPAERFYRLADLRKRLAVDNQTIYPPLTWGQVNEMHGAGVCFGSHTVYHSILPVAEETVLLQELQVSKHRIESELGVPCKLFAYPDGKHDARTRLALDSCGYHLAVTQDWGCNQDEEQRLNLKRIEIPFHDPMSSFRARVSLSLKGSG